MNIACGTRFTINELFDRVKKLIGSDLDPIYADARPGDVKHSEADISRAAELFDYKIEESFEEGLEKTVDWYRDSLG